MRDKPKLEYPKDNNGKSYDPLSVKSLNDLAQLLEKNSLMEEEKKNNRVAKESSFKRNEKIPYLIGNYVPSPLKLMNSEIPVISISHERDRSEEKLDKAKMCKLPYENRYINKASHKNSSPNGNSRVEKRRAVVERRKLHNKMITNQHSFLRDLRERKQNDKIEQSAAARTIQKFLKRNYKSRKNVDRCWFDREKVSKIISQVDQNIRQTKPKSEQQMRLVVEQVLSRM